LLYRIYFSSQIVVVDLCVCATTKRYIWSVVRFVKGIVIQQPYGV